MRKKCTFLLRLGILQMCLLWGFLGNIRTAKADLILDQAVIDGSHNIFFDAQPLREIQYNGTVVWRAGADITYVIDGGISETHFVPYGETTLAVSADKAGYEFVGWRPDQTASGDVLTADLCTGDEKTLYAVFRKAVTVAYYNGSATKQTAAGYIYYNNGSLKNPDFTIPQTPLSGWTARGWARGQAADAGTEYTVLDHTVLTSDITLYGVYQKTITASFDGNGAGSGSVSALTATAYYNSAGNTLNPSFRMPANGFTKNGYTWSGWKQGSTGITRAAGENVTLSASTTFAAQWQVEKVKITFVEAGVSTTVEYEKGTSVNRNSIAPSGTTFVGWSTTASGANPVKTLVATQDTTYYRVIKYDDYVIGRVDVANGEEMGGPYTVNTSNYPTLQIDAYAIFASGGTELSTTRYWKDEDDDKYHCTDAFVKVYAGAGDDKTVTCITQSPFYMYLENYDGSGYTIVTAIGAQKVG